MEEHDIELPEEGLGEEEIEERDTFSAEQVQSSCDTACLRSSDQFYIV